jgi:anti-anti-sigma regulatory factor
MSTPLHCDRTQDGARAVVTVRGSLDGVNAARLRTTLLKALADQPAALLVDVAGMTVADKASTAVFSAVARQAAMWPAVPVLLCAPSEPVAHLLARRGALAVPRFASLAEAAASLDDARLVQPRVSDELLPIDGAARHARNLATEACARWDLPDLIWPASLVVNELVSNVVQHARTMMTVRFTLGGRYLHISVRDGSSALPQVPDPPTAAPEGGRGLLIVQELAAHWGSLPTDGGKVVWATLPVPGRINGSAGAGRG